MQSSTQLLSVSNISLSASRSRKLWQRSVNFFCIGCQLRGSCKHTTYAYWLLLKDWRPSSCTVSIAQVGIERQALYGRPWQRLGCNCSLGCNMASIRFIHQDTAKICLGMTRKGKVLRFNKATNTFHMESGWVTNRPSFTQAAALCRTEQTCWWCRLTGNCSLLSFRLYCHRNRRRRKTQYTWQRLDKHVLWTGGWKKYEAFRTTLSVLRLDQDHREFYFVRHCRRWCKKPLSTVKKKI